MEYFKKVRGILSRLFSSLFVYANDELFDEDFRQVLQIFYFFGVYRPVPSTPRSVYGIGSIVIVLIGHLLGMLLGAYRNLNRGQLQECLICFGLFGLLIVIMIQVITLMTKKNEIIAMIKAFHSLHCAEGEATMTYYQNKSCMIVKIYRTSIEVATSTLVICHLCGYKSFRLVMPSLLEVYADGSLYYPLLIVNIIHMYFFVLFVVATDLLHVQCVVRAGANYKILSEKLRHSTNSEDLNENEDQLNACVKYHQRIVE